MKENTLIHSLLLLFLTSIAIDSLGQTPSKKNKYLSLDSIYSLAYRTESPKLETSFNSFPKLKDFPKKWICLSKCSLGIFIYNKGNEIEIRNDTLIFQGSEESVSWPIMGYEMVENTKYQIKLGNDSLKKTFAISSFEIVDLDTIYTVQKTQIFRYEEGERKQLGGYSSLLIPYEKQHLFYHIDEPNKNSPASIIQFENIDLDKFKKTKSVRY